MNVLSLCSPVCSANGVCLFVVVWLIFTGGAFRTPNAGPNAGHSFAAEEESVECKIHTTPVELPLSSIVRKAQTICTAESILRLHALLGDVLYVYVYIFAVSRTAVGHEVAVGPTECR